MGHYEHYALLPRVQHRVIDDTKHLLLLPSGVFGTLPVPLCGRIAFGQRSTAGTGDTAGTGEWTAMVD